MEFDDAKEVIKQGYVKAGFELVDEHPKELFFRYRGMTSNWRISEDEIGEFALSADHIAAMQIGPGECGIYSLNYREHALASTAQSSRAGYFSRYTLVFGETGLKNTYAKIGPATQLFVNTLFSNGSYMSVLQDKIRRFSPVRSGAHLLYNPPTIRIYNLQQPSTEAALEKSTPIIDSCLFTLAYMLDMSLTLMEDWPKRQPREKPFRYGETYSSGNLPFPRAIYNVDLIRFYQRGLVLQRGVQEKPSELDHNKRHGILPQTDLTWIEEGTHAPHYCSTDLPAASVQLDRDRYRSLAA